VAAPDESGIQDETFGDVAAVTVFVSCRNQCRGATTTTWWWDLRASVS
ncbi:unnamed protein product, partial [Larinioides sclopetarius]